VLPIAAVVTTSCGQLPGSDRPTGTSLPQVAVVCDALHHVGWTPVLASPAGGAVPIDPVGAGPEWAAARAELAATTPLRALSPPDVGLWIVLGGPGALGDLADDAELATRLQGATDDARSSWRSITAPAPSPPGRTAVIRSPPVVGSPDPATPRHGDRRARWAPVLPSSSGCVPPAAATRPGPPADHTSSSTATW
jgi:hypothetical protein